MGKLGSTYGIRGWLRIYSSTEQAESIFDYQPWFLKIKGEWQPTELENWRHHNHEIIVKLKGVDDREAAQTLANVEIGVDLSVFPELEEGDSAGAVYRFCSSPEQKNESRHGFSDCRIYNC